MHKEKNRRSQVQNWSTASASLRDYVGKTVREHFWQQNLYGFMWRCISVMARTLK